MERRWILRASGWFGVPLCLVGMASILILSVYGSGVPIGLRLAQEGHIVKIWIKEQNARANLDGYRNPSKIQEPRRMLEQYDLVLSDMVGLGPLCEELRSKGKLVLGGGTFNDKLELDREFGLKVCRSLMKVKEPTSRTFKTVEECLEYLESATTPQVVKPLGNAPVYLTLVSSDGENRTLKSLLKEKGKELVPCIIQERVEGIEISTEGWFDSKEWVLPFNHTFEKKRLMEGDKGPNTGCMGNVVFTTEGDKLVETLLIPLTPLLKKVEYVGPIDVNCIVDEKDAYFLEFTARFGYDAIQALAELLKIPLFDFLYGVAARQIKKVQVYDGYGGAVRLSIHPYPLREGHKESRGVKFLEIPEEGRRHIWLADVMMDKELGEVCAGVDGVLGSVTARGESVRECRRRIYRTVKNIVIHRDVQYRGDIGEIEESVQQLKEWGWLN